MHKSENVIGVLTRIVDAKLRLCRLEECRMKITAPVPSAKDRKADHQTKDRSAAQHLHPRRFRLTRRDRRRCLRHLWRKSALYRVGPFRFNDWKFAKVRLTEVKYLQH